MMREQASGPLGVLVTGEVNDAQMCQIRAAVPDADCRYVATSSELEAQVGDAEVVAGNLRATGLARAQ